LMLGSLDKHYRVHSMFQSCKSILNEYFWVVYLKIFNGRNFVLQLG
jgi:hypothetical protein